MSIDMEQEQRTKKREETHMEDIRTIYEPRMKAYEFELQVFFPHLFNKQAHAQYDTFSLAFAKQQGWKDEKEGREARVCM